MAVFLQDWDRPFPDACRGGALTIGNFDGVHRGHAALLQEVGRQTQRVPGPAVALTFEPHPLQLLRPADFQPILTTASQRAKLMHAGGANHVVILRTNRELLALTADAFFAEVIQHRLGARALIEGVNFGFGRNREGNIETLRELCRSSGLEIVVVPPVLFDGVPISSSRVRRVLELGAVREAAELLGRPYCLRGAVVEGQKRGRTLGFPTANLQEIPTLIPGDGVYAVRVLIEESLWPGAANIGPNPTFGEQARKVEVHLIGFSGDLMGDMLELQFLQRLRDTTRFESVDALVAQLRRDVELASRIAGSTN